MLQVLSGEPWVLPANPLSPWLDVIRSPFSSIVTGGEESFTGEASRVCIVKAAWSGGSEDADHLQNGEYKYTYFELPAPSRSYY